MYRTSRDLRDLFEVLPRADDGREIALPSVILDSIAPAVDLRDWRRYTQRQTEIQGSNSASTVPSSLVPLDSLRLVIQASVEDIRGVAADRIIWIERETAIGGSGVAVTPAFFAPTGVAQANHGTNRPLILGPEDFLEARVSPAAGAGDTLRIKMTFIEFPLDTIALPPA